MKIPRSELLMVFAAFVVLVGAVVLVARLTSGSWREVPPPERAAPAAAPVGAARAKPDLPAAPVGAARAKPDLPAAPAVPAPRTEEVESPKGEGPATPEGESPSSEEAAAEKPETPKPDASPAAE